MLSQACASRTWLSMVIPLGFPLNSLLQRLSTAIVTGLHRARTWSQCSLPPGLLPLGDLSQPEGGISARQQLSHSSCYETGLLQHKDLLFSQSRGSNSICQPNKCLHGRLRNTPWNPSL